MGENTPLNNTQSTQKEDKKSRTSKISAGGLGRRKKMIMGILLILIGVGAVFFIAYPMYNNYKASKVTLEQKQKELSDLQLRVDQLKKVERLVATIEKNTELTKQAVPEETDIPVAMGMIQEIANSSGVKITSFSYAGLANSAMASPSTAENGQPAANGGNQQYDAFKLNIALRGRYDNLQDFLQNLETSRRIYDATNFAYSVERGGTEVVSNIYTMRLLLTAYNKEFTPSAVEINLDNYTDVIAELESMRFYVVSLDQNVGKEDPFSDNVEGQGSSFFVEDDVVDINVVEIEGATASDGSEFFNNNTNNTNINEQQNANNPSFFEEEEQDIEAEEGNTLEVLQELLKQEGVSP